MARLLHPVRLHERDPVSFRLVQRHAKPYWDMPYEVYACDGKLSGRLDGRSPFTPNDPGVQVEHLVAFLEGRPCCWEKGDLKRRY